LRALIEDLRLPVPPADDLLDEIDHPLLAKANEQFTGRRTGHERIRAVKDEVLFKVKVQRWRGAAWIEEDQPWLVAAGAREEGSPDDFYAALAADAEAARARYNTEHTQPLPTSTFIGHLLPDESDRIRLLAEEATRAVRRLREGVRTITAASLRDGHEHRLSAGASIIGVQVRADHGHETYAAVRITGPVPTDLVSLVLELVPGTDPTGWGPELRMPDRALIGNEQVWSTLMDPTAAARLLDEHDHDA